MNHLGKDSPILGRTRPCTTLTCRPAPCHPLFSPCSLGCWQNITIKNGWTDGFLRQLLYHNIHTKYFAISSNRATPKSSILMGFSILKQLLGYPHGHGNHQLVLPRFPWSSPPDSSSFRATIRRQSCRASDLGGSSWYHGCTWFFDLGSFQAMGVPPNHLGWLRESPNQMRMFFLWYPYSRKPPVRDDAP